MIHPRAAALLVLAIVLGGLLPIRLQAEPEVRVIVALADNASQGILPVPAEIGNGDDPANNLYWGCSEGLKSVFSASRDWKRTEVIPNPAPAVLERCVFVHRSGRLRLVADAYRGSQIRQGTVDFFAALSSDQPATELPLVAYLGHDGLMDFALPESATAGRSSQRAAIVLCCKSDAFFGPHLERIGARPILMTTQLMYPGAFILKAVLDGWMAGESREQLRERAARSYAANQKISVKAARGVFPSASP
ncbi:MAG: hypothetical protein QOE70_4191 [Chthoniobacter sp.]|nr:hypothetical protein [Chthoniobacter sp.]